MLRMRWRRSSVSAATTETPQGPWAGARVDVRELVALRPQARGIQLARRQPSVSVISGLYQSRFRGRGMDYQESSVYEPGDNMRNMDLRITARPGRPHTKLFQEERARPVMVLVDLGPSMFFGTRGAFKSAIAVRAASLISWAAVHGGDRIGALLANGEHHELPPMGGRRGALRVIRSLVSATIPVNGGAIASRLGGLSEALRRLRRFARPGSLIFIISDFYAMDDDTERHLRYLKQHNAVIACQIVDVVELAHPPPARYDITDVEEGGILDTGSVNLRSRYQAFFREHHYAVRELLRKGAVPLVVLKTSDDVAERLMCDLARHHPVASTPTEIAA